MAFLGTAWKGSTRAYEYDNNLDQIVRLHARTRAAIPDVEILLALEPKELGAKTLFLVRGRQDAGMLNLSTDEANGWISHRQTEPTASQSAL
jgi:hypothetical protein